jgi:hypothetical protein
MCIWSRRFASRSLRAFPEMIRRRSGTWRATVTVERRKASASGAASLDATRALAARPTLALAGATTINKKAPVGAPPTLRFGVSEGKMQNPDAEMRARERDGLFDIVSFRVRGNSREPRGRWLPASSLRRALKRVHARLQRAMAPVSRMRRRAPRGRPFRPFMRYARSALISQIFVLESTRAGADGTQARAQLSHSKRP